MQSIESQRAELQRLVLASHAEVVETFEEAQSARRPGRSVFTDMLRRLKAGEADGIVAWAPDRLARNATDGGHILELLDERVIRDLKFATYTFENNAQGKFMLQIMFGQSKYYSDALSDVVKRGNRTKAAAGWRPGVAPLGYRNDAQTKTIVVDPTYAPLVRRMFDLALTGGYSARRIAQIAKDEWGFRTPFTRKRGGVPMPPNSVLQLLTNPFYSGQFTWEGATMRGRHVPIVTEEEFAAVQAAIRRPKSRAQRHSFPFTGLIRCGACGRMVTAEHKTNRFGTKYTYYHCSRGRFAPVCRQPSIRAEALEQQVLRRLSELALNPKIGSRLLQVLQNTVDRASSSAGLLRENIDRALRDIQGQITSLTDLRLRQLIGDAEFVGQRERLHAEAARLAHELDKLAQAPDAIEPLQDLMSFSNQAVDWFRRSDDEHKRLIIKTVGSHLTLTDKILSFEAAQWWRELAKYLPCPSKLGGQVDVRTLELDSVAADEHLRPFLDTLRAPEISEQLSAIREIRCRVVGTDDQASKSASPTSPRSPFVRRARRSAQAASATKPPMRRTG